MKKFLSLVLALVMTMSLVTISAGAKDFTDDSSITYGEAVDVVSALKIVDGYTDGSFNPSATLTRGAAAKIICNLILGPTTASALVADSAPYVDVPTSNTFAGYIAYCAQQGIISGYADGTFRPAGTLTGYAFMKMLLGALGYDSKIEGFVGANWSVQVAKTAIGAGLNTGNEDFNGVQPVTREQAALYAFNTLKADMVDYDNKGSSITVSGVEIVTSPSKAEPIRTGDTGKLNTVKFSTSDALQFGEKYFNNLTVSVIAKDNFGRPANQWKLKGTEIGKYAKTAALTYTDEVSGDDIYDDLAKPFVESTDIYTNSATAAPVAGFSVADNNKIKLGGHAQTVSVYTADNDDNDRLEIVITVVENFGAQVQAVTEARGDNKRYVTLDNGMTFETEEFEEDDVVVYTMTDPSIAASAKVRTMALAEETPGMKVTKINRTKDTFTADDKTYDFSANLDANSNETLTAGNTYDVYTDANGYVVYIIETEASANQYAVVLANATSTWSDGNGRVRLLLSDGKKVEVEAELKTGTTLTDGELVVYTVDDDGVYSIDADPTLATPTQIKNDISNLGGGAYADSKTVFFVLTAENTANNTINSANTIDTTDIYIGVKNVPDVTIGGGTAAAVCDANGVAKAVVLLNTSLSNSDMTYIVSKGFAEFTEKSTQYYAFNAVIDGEITTLEIKASEVTSVLDANSNGKLDAAVFGLSTTDVNSNGRATRITLATGANRYYTGTVTTGYKKDVVYINSQYLTVDADIDVFVVADDGEIIAATPASLSRGQKVAYTLNSTEDRIVSAVVYTDIDSAVTWG